jgi:hypothetical protein
VQEARKHNLANVLLSNLPMLGLTEAYYGLPTAGRECLKEALELAKRVGDVRSELLIHLCFAPGYLIQAQHVDAEAHGRKALELAKQLGARRFQAECTGILAIAHLARGEQAKALQLARDSVELGRETGMSYCGPVLLSLVARATDNPLEQAKVLQEGETLLASGCVSHSYLDFYANAIEVSLQGKQWSEARRYAQCLEAYTSREPMPLTTVLVRRARLLADFGEGRRDQELESELENVRGDCLKMNARAALVAIENTLSDIRMPVG